jgi:DNA-binding transcriptional LysR family regulator
MERRCSIIDRDAIITMLAAPRKSWYDIQLGGPIFEAFRAIGLEVLRARISSGSLNLRNSLMATGRFLTTVPGSVLRFGPKHLSIKVLPIELPRWRLPTAIITLKNRTLSPLAQLFIDCAREVAKPRAKQDR